MVPASFCKMAALCSAHRDRTASLWRPKRRHVARASMAMTHVHTLTAIIPLCASAAHCAQRLHANGMRPMCNIPPPPKRNYEDHGFRLRKRFSFETVSRHTGHVRSYGSLVTACFDHGRRAALFLAFILLMTDPARAAGQQCGTFDTRDCQVDVKRSLNPNDSAKVKIRCNLTSQSAAIDPDAAGLRLSLTDGTCSGLCFDETVRPKRQGSCWRYKSFIPGGIKSLQLCELSPLNYRLSARITVPDALACMETLPSPHVLGVGIMVANTCIPSCLCCPLPTPIGSPTPTPAVPLDCTSRMNNCGGVACRDSDERCLWNGSECSCLQLEDACDATCGAGLGLCPRSDQTCNRNTESCSCTGR